MPEPVVRCDFYNKLGLLESTLIVVTVNMQSRQKEVIEGEQRVGFHRLFLLVDGLGQPVESGKYNRSPMRGKSRSGVHFDGSVQLLQSLVPAVFVQRPQQRTN